MSHTPSLDTTPGRHKLAGLDHLRALAIILVLLFHYRIFAHPDWIDTIGSFGWTGVDLFFVLSGYLIAGQLFRQVAEIGTFSLKGFYIKRFLRIMPAYLVVVAIYFCIPAFRERESLSPLWKFLTFTQNFGLDLRHNGTFSHSWSLCIEEQFYLLLPFIILTFLYLKLRRSAAVVIIVLLFIAGVCCRLLSWHVFILPALGTDFAGAVWYKYMYYVTYNRLDGLLAGISIAGLYQFYPQAKERIIRNGDSLFITGIIVLSFAYYLCLDPTSFPASIFGFPVVALGYGLLVAAALSPRCFLYRYPSKITAVIASLSYAIYLTHKGIIHITQQCLGNLGIKQDSTLMFICCIATIFAGALLLRLCIEKPFLRIKEHLLNK